jgi:hypothetical protein
VNHPSILWWANGNEGGWNSEVDGDFARWDIQQRPVLHPWEDFSGFQTKHYPTWQQLQRNLAGLSLVMPTEFLHGLYDGGSGAGLDDHWRRMWGKPLTGGILWGWGLTIVGTIHLMFLPSILPPILEGFQLTEQAAITTAGTIMMAYTATAIIGNYLLISLASRLGLARLITIACLSAAALQGLLYFSTGVYSFTLIRMLQTGMIAAVIPLVISTFAGEGGGGTTLGFLNSGRFVGNALGPMMATAILSHFDLLTLYLTIAGLTLAMLWAFLASRRMQASFGSDRG